MNFKEFRFVFIDTEYLKYLRGFDSEIFFSSNTDYSKKPHLGILTNCHDRKYVIPLTSAKEKHILWRDVTATKQIRMILLLMNPILISYDRKTFRKMSLFTTKKEFFLSWKSKKCSP